MSPGVLRAMLLALLVAAAPASGSYYDEVMADSPVAYWRLGESSGTTAYDSAGIHTGTHSGTVALGRPGALVGDSNTAMSFGGGNVRVPYSADLDGDTFTVECWARPSSVGGGSWRSPLMYRWVDSSQPGPPCYGYNLYANASNTNWEFWIGQGTAAGSFASVAGPPADVGEWSHLVGTYDGTTMRLYVDGLLRSSSVRAHGVNVNPSTFLEIGGGPRFLGDLDEVAVYNTALPSSRVVSHYIAGKHPTAQGTAVWPGGDLLVLHLDEGAGSTVHDSSTHGQTGTIHGAQWAGGKFGGALSFDDPGDHVELSSFPAGSYAQLTVEAWVNLGDKQGRNELLNEQTGDSIWMNFDTNGADKLDVYLGDTTSRGYHSTNAAIPRGEWTHVAFTYDDDVDTLKLYVNGLLDREATTSGLINLDSTLFFGSRRWDYPENSFEGLADELAVYSRVLSPDEMLARFLGGPPAAMPEPTTLALLGLGSLALAARRRRHNKTV